MLSERFYISYLYLNGNKQTVITDIVKLLQRRWQNKVVHMPNKKCMSIKHDTRNLRSIVKITAWQSTNNRQKVDSVK